MRRLVSLLIAALAGTEGAAAAQERPFSVRPSIGVFAPALPLVAVADGYHPHVRLGGGPLVGMEIGYRIAPAVGVYGGVSTVLTRLYHSGAMELRDVDGPYSSRATLVTPTAGIQLSPRFSALDIEPTVRLGIGSKLYYFDLHDVNSPVANLTGDLGVGILAGAGPLRVLAEARWMPSRFDARYLPVRTMGSERQTQNDWTFQIGFRTGR
jgi:hypothetical protein